MLTCLQQKTYDAGVEFQTKLDLDEIAEKAAIFDFYRAENRVHIKPAKKNSISYQ
jgi:hypothetical protein